MAILVTINQFTSQKKIHGGGGRIRPGNTINSPRNRLKIRFRGRHQKVKLSQIAHVTITSGRALSSSFVFIVCISWFRALNLCVKLYTQKSVVKKLEPYSIPYLAYPCRTQVRQNTYIFAVARSRRSVGGRVFVFGRLVKNLHVDH